MRLGRVCVADATEVLKTPAPSDKDEWRAILRTLGGKVRAIFTVPFDAYRKTYVAIPEPAALSGLLNSMTRLGPALNRHWKGHTSKGLATLDQITASLAEIEKKLLRSRDLTPQPSAARRGTPPTKPAPIQTATIQTATIQSGVKPAPARASAPTSVAATGSSAAEPPSLPEGWATPSAGVEEASASTQGFWTIALGLFGTLGLAGVLLFVTRRRS